MANRNSYQVIYDRAEIKGPARITRDGYLVADVLVARANNIQTYRAHELGLTDRKPDEQVRVFRPESEVFHKDALTSLAHRPVTIDHPSESVTAENWRKLAVGDIGSEVLRDGEFVRVPMKIMDAGAVERISTDHQEFSLGYSVDLDMSPGEHNGQAYDAVARSLRYNHLAAVKAARGGTELRIVDERTYNPESNGGNNPSDARRETSGPGGGGAPTRDGGLKMPHTLIIDGLQVPNVSDEAKAAIEKLQGQLKDEREGRAADKTATETQIATLTTDKATLEAKVTTLEKQIEDSKVTPAQLRDAAKAYAMTVGKAKAMGVDVTDEMDEPAIMKAVVTAKIGDAAEGWNDVQIAASFATLAKDVRPAEGTDPLRLALADGPKPNTGTTEIKDAYEAMVGDMTKAWQPKQAA